MRIKAKSFASLSRYQPEDTENHQVPQGATVGEVVDGLGIDRKEVNLLFVNGVKADFERTLEEGDQLGIFPAVGGG